MTKILIIKHSAFGDFIQSLGCLKAIRAHHAGAHITLMTTKPFELLARQSGYLDDVYIDTRPKWYQFKKWCALRAWLNDQNFTRVYDLQNSERTSIYYKLFAKTPIWNGIASDVTDGPERRVKHVFQALAHQLALVGVAPVMHDDLSWIRADVSAF